MLPKGNAGTFDVFSFSWYDCRKDRFANATSDGSVEHFFPLKHVKKTSEVVTYNNNLSYFL